MAPAAIASRLSAAAQKPHKIRYFRGKAPEAARDSDSDEDDEEQQPVQQPAIVDRNLVAGGAGRIIRNPGLDIKQKVKVDLAGIQLGKQLPIKRGLWIFHTCGWF
jgi:hypothetical protein